MTPIADVDVNSAGNCVLRERERIRKLAEVGGRVEIRLNEREQRVVQRLKRLFGTRPGQLGVVLFFGLVPLLAYAVSKPNTFTDGSTVSAAQMNQNFDTVYNAVTALENRTTKKIMWSGGCSSHGTSGGYNTYCTNATDFNTAADYLTVTSGGTFTVKVAGYYRINYWGISLGNNYCYILMYRNGSYFSHQHNYCGNEGAWTDNMSDQTWPMNVGDTFYVTIYNPGSYAYHSWNANGAHSRLQVSYEGTL